MLVKTNMFQVILPVNAVFTISVVLVPYTVLYRRPIVVANVIINITSDVTLSSPVQLMNINNITIVGHNNPTVKLNNTGALYFTLSHNIRIQEIEWERCGTNCWHSNPGLKMYNCSGVNI